MSRDLWALLLLICGGIAFAYAVAGTAVLRVACIVAGCGVAAVALLLLAGRL